MKCVKCEGEMEYTRTYNRGRHVREMYRCKKCKNMKDIKISLIPNLKRGR